jgi:hypothetical protein
MGGAGRAGQFGAPARARRYSLARRLGAATGPSAGRWSRTPAGGSDEPGGPRGPRGPDRPEVLGRPEGPGRPEGLDRHDLAEAVAEQLLHRWGVLFRDLAARDNPGLPWRELQWALRRLEDRGLVRGGRFVSGFSGEQYALPEAAEQLARVRKTPRTGERVVVNATDPLNLVGCVVPGQTVPAVRTNRVVYIDGVPDDSGSPDDATATGNPDALMARK